MRIRSLSFFTFLAMAFYGSLGFAKPKLVVFPIVPLDGVPDSAAQSMTQSLMEELQSARDLDVLVGKETAEGGAPRGHRGPAKSVRAHRDALDKLAKGQEHAERLRFPQAIRSLEEGLQKLAETLDQLDDYELLISAHITLAESYFRRGQEAAGIDVLERLARLRPDVKLDPERYPPMFINVVGDVQRRAMARPRGALRVNSAPVGAQVELNGKALGRTPILIESIIPGAQHLVVRSGNDAVARVVQVAEGKAQVEEFSFGGASSASASLTEAIGANRFDKRLRATAQRMGRASGGDLVLLLAMAPGRGVYNVGSFLGNARTGRWVELVAMVPDLDMLSASIEAHALVRDVRKHLENLQDSVGDATLPFVAGAKVQAERPGAAMREERVQFVPSSMAVASAGGARAPVGRGPVQPTAAKPSRDSLELVPVPAASSEDRQPVDKTVARGPVRRGEETGVEEASRVPTGPVTARRGPVMRDPEGLPLPEEKDAPHVVVATSLTPAAGSGPAAVDLTAEAGGRRGIYHEWWFWTAVGVGVAAIAGGVTWGVMSARAANSLDVRAVW